MSRPDALEQLKRFALELGYFDQGQGAGEGAAPVFYRAARGCLDVLGGLEAEAGGTMAQMVLPLQVAVGVQPLSEPVLRVRSMQVQGRGGGDGGEGFDLRAIAGKPQAEVVRYLAGMAAGPLAWAAPILALWWRLDPAAAERGMWRGARVLIHGVVPIGAGQASGSALLAALAMAIVEGQGESAGGGAEALAVAQWVAAAEALGAAGTHTVISAPGDVVNALTCMYERPAGGAARGGAEVLRYSAQPYRFVGPVPLPADVRVLALDTGVRFNSPRTTLEELQVAAAMGRRIIDQIYRDLGQPHTPLHGYLANTSPLLYRQYFRALLPRRLRGSDFVRTYGPLPEQYAAAISDDVAGLYRVRTAVDHLIAENEHAEQFLQSMEELADAAEAGGDGGRGGMEEGERERVLQRAGRLLLASHHSYRLRLELSCREADWLVDHLMEIGPERGIFGARITGLGGGGTVVALLDRSGAATDGLLEVMKHYGEFTGVGLGITEA